MNHLIQLVSSGLALGAVYALVAVGLVVVYRASAVFNFAQGEFLSIGAFSMVALLDRGLPWGVALTGAMTLAGLAAALVGRGLMRPLSGRPVLIGTVLTVFIGFLLRATISGWFGGEPRPMPTPWTATGFFAIRETRIPWNALASCAAAAIVLAGFFVLMHRTRLGVALRATASDPETALAQGIPVGRMLGLTWFLSGAIAAVGGVCLGMFPGKVDPNIGLSALGALPAVILGGLQSHVGAVVAGLSLGTLQVLAKEFFNPALGELGHDFHEVFPYLLMVVVLAVRPHGLFADRAVARV